MGKKIDVSTGVTNSGTQHTGRRRDDCKLLTGRGITRLCDLRGPNRHSPKRSRSQQMVIHVSQGGCKWPEFLAAAVAITG